MTQSVAFQPHDHTHCIQSAIARAQQLCSERKLRLTPIRQLVLELVWASHKPLGAYDLLPALKAAGYNSAPPTVYRALEFLQQQGFVHRIALLNAYVGCPHPGEEHDVFFLICKQCGAAVEAHSDSARSAITAEATRLGFTPASINLEVLGYCPNCEALAPQQDPAP